jgi:hypothetical protein
VPAPIEPELEPPRPPPELAPPELEPAADALGGLLDADDALGAGAFPDEHARSDATRTPRGTSRRMSRT